MIEFRDISLRLGGKSVLMDFNLKADGGFLSLLAGANGAGKSSSFKIAAGSWRASGGEIHVDGRKLSGNPFLRRERLAYLPQSPAFHSRLKTRQILAFYARLEERSRNEADARLEQFGLESHADYRTKALSGGLRQRLGLAVISLSRAPVLLLDEPGLSLDPYWRARLQAWLRSEAASGRTVVVATHLLGEWENRADACFLCQHGKIIGQLDPSNLRNSALFSLPDADLEEDENAADDKTRKRRSADG